MESRYAVLMETSGREFESWYTFIKVEGNEENLKHLFDQLSQVDLYILDDYSSFDLELERTVSAQTAKEMSKLDLNPTMFHRKFDGVLKRVDFNFGEKLKNKKKIKIVNEILGFGGIEEFIDQEDIDEEDLASDLSSDDTDNESASSDSDDDGKKDDLPPALRLRESIAKKQAERQKKKKEV
jgi:hypothetical protein